MVSVIILDGLSDNTTSGDKAKLLEIENIYIPLLVGVLRYNGIMCEAVKISGFEKEYGIKGKNRDNIIYAPIISYFSSPTELSFIYTDSTESDSPSFRIATELRKVRSIIGESVVFVNELHENDPLKMNSPVVVDNICFNAQKGIKKETVYKLVTDAARSICICCGQDFFDPAQSL